MSAKQSICLYRMMRDRVSGCGATLFHSTELDEAAHLCDRCPVMCRNRIAGEVTVRRSCRS